MHWRAYARKRTLKKTAGLTKTRAIVEKFKDRYPAPLMARVLGVSRQRVYRILRTPLVGSRRKTMKNDKDLIQKIQEISKQFSFYGYRKVTALLHFRYGIQVNRKKVYRIMKEQQLLMPVSHSHRKLFRGVPFSYKLEATKPNELWGIDMTYIWCGSDGWGYLHAIIDHFDKSILGYHFSLSCKAVGAVMALADATSLRMPTNLELRSDNGCHYGSKIFRQELKRLGIDHTRTMINTPKGNAIIERFFRSLKEECVWQKPFQNFTEAEESVKNWIEEYNECRPHQALNYATPAAFYERTVRTAA